SDEELKFLEPHWLRHPDPHTLAEFGADEILYATDFIEKIGRHRDKVLRDLTHPMERCYDCPACDRAAPDHRPPRGDACERPIYASLRQRRRGRPEHNPAESYARGIAAYFIE